MCRADRGQSMATATTHRTGTREPGYKANYLTHWQLLSDCNSQVLQLLAY
jgi:hypothetical protein